MDIFDSKERPFVSLEQMAEYSARDRDTASKYGPLVKAAQISNRDYGYRYSRFSRVPSSPTFSRGLGSPLVVRDPALGEPIELVQLRRRSGGWDEVHFEPSEQMRFDELERKVWVAGVNAVHGLGNRKPLPIFPDDLALLGVDLDLF